MKKILNKNINNRIALIVLIVVLLLITSGISVYATTTYFASQITYKDNKTVEYALNDLYTKSNKTPQQVATLTTRGTTYTMENDGYITGTAVGENPSTGNTGYVAYLTIQNKIYVISSINNVAYDVSVYVHAGDTITTRADHGTYNLTVYEWK